MITSKIVISHMLYVGSAVCVPFLTKMISTMIAATTLQNAMSSSWRNHGAEPWEEDRGLNTHKSRGTKIPANIRRRSSEVWMLETNIIAWAKIKRSVMMFEMQMK